MSIGRPMPQDILKYEAKFALGLTTRKCIWYGCGMLLIIIGFFWLVPAFGITDIQTKAIISACLGVPFMVWGAIKPFGENPEKVLIPFIFDNFLNPSKRLKEEHDELYEAYTKNKVLTKKEKKKASKVKSSYKMIR